MKILAVDDDPSLRRLLYFFLKDQYEVVTLASAEEAIEYVRANPPDAVIMDVGFGGGMDGDEAVLELRRTHPHLPIIALSGYVFKRHREICRDVGYTDFVPKPFSQEQIIASLEKWLSYTLART
ncbi:MAG: response regulator [Bacteroidetes Order II. Incertae sedis bacterium]|nr:response regulator [Bacteroidetes Order II. bacterium]